MADYYSLLARKIGPPQQSTPEARQAVYDLARRALVNQLRAIQPPVEDQVIQNEGRALEDAIARLEAEAAPAPAEDAPRPPEPEPEAPPAEAETPPAKGEAPSAPVSEPPRERVRPAAPLPPAPERGGRSRRFVLIAVALILTVGLVALAALRFRERPEDLAKLNPEETTTREAESKLSARVGGDAKEAPEAAAPAAPVARRAALLVGPKGRPDKPDRVYDGSVVWRLENVSGDEGAPVQPAIRGDIDFPDAKIKATIVFQKNVDATLSASHMITLTFSVLPGSDIKGVKAIGALQTRRPDAQSGERLAGIPVPTTENSFLMGLMRGDSEKRNIALLSAPTLIDIPLQFSDDRMGTINLEKGASGDRVFQDAIAAWSR